MRTMPQFGRSEGYQFAGSGLDSGGGGDSYTTDEQETKDKWIDGKTIYCKTFVVTNGSSPQVLQGISNVDTVVDFSAISHRRYGDFEGWFPTGTQIGNSYFNLVIEKMSDNTLRFETYISDSGWIFIKTIITVYYTKRG